MNVVIVESPAKAKTINKYLGPDYEVLASFGHVRDLPAKDGSVATDDDFRMSWEVDPKSAKRLSDIARAVKGADKLILATDPDREGEAISWHVLEVLREKKALKGQKVERVVFNAVTKSAVLDAMKAPREIHADLVDAYLARRALDYLFGFTLSPVLWRKLPGARSAGRVQSVALRLVCDRELEIERFKEREYWTIAAQLATPKGQPFEARLAGIESKKLSKFDIPDEKTATALKLALEKASFRIRGVEAKPVKRHPWPPFTTSTLQQEASRKLGLAPARTMQLAQRLYEGIDIGGETVGLITYMRTDGVQMAPEAIAQTRRVIGSDFGDNYVPSAPRMYKTKAKNAQEAHEAIRPTDLTRRPKDIGRFLEDEQRKLYELIWKRTIASQMESAEMLRTTADIEGNSEGRIYDLSAVGTVVTFDGFLALYQESRDDDADDEDSRRLPAMAPGEPAARRGITAEKHITEPPPRYSEASLVKRMEELGIGRPSTYASILQVLKDRDYVIIDKKRLVPQDKGRLVTAFLESFFAHYVEYDFTALLEERLDEVSDGKLNWRAFLREFWDAFSGHVAGTKELRVAQVLDALDQLLAPHLFPDKEDGSDPRKCPSCADGRLSLKLGKFGAFIGCTNYPECRHTRPFAAGGEEGTTTESGPRVLGKDPETGFDITVRDGRFGPYIQLGEGEKPKRSSLPKGVKAADIDFETARALLALPRTVGRHPETSEPILAGIGRFGPYVQHGRTYANIEAGDDVLTIGLNRAVTLIAEKETRGSRPRGNADPGRDLGPHPTLGENIFAKAGRYGPYVACAGINATLPRGKAADAVTLEEAIAMIDAKAASGGGKAKGRKGAKAKAPAKAKADGAEKAPAKKAASKKTASTKAATKKPAAKKAAPKKAPAKAKAATE